MATPIISHVQKEIKSAQQNASFYVYVLFYPTGKPFYVGKATIRSGGLSERVFYHVKEARAGYGYNKFKNRVINKIEASGKRIVYEIESFHLTEESAFNREIELIAQYGRRQHGGTLTNLSDGGEGAGGGTFQTQSGVDVRREKRRKPLDALTGRRFGMLVVMGDAYFEPDTKRTQFKSYRRYVKCVCDCGNEVEVDEASLLHARKNPNHKGKKDCGCVWKAAGKLKSDNKPEYKSWQKMRDKHPADQICAEWLPRDSFRVFLEQMGKKPKGSVLTRINPQLSWSAGNCKWSRKSHYHETGSALTINGITKSARAWSRETGVPQDTISSRLKRGWSIEDAVMKPCMRRT